MSEMTGWPVGRRKPLNELQPSKAALRLITSFEGLSLKAYRDSVGILTAGYGHTGPDVLEGMAVTLKQADDWLDDDIAEAWGIVTSSVQVPLTQGEADALTSIAFNLGKIPRSMLAALNGGVSDKGEQYAPGSYGSALKQFPRNCRAGGVPLRGLYRRRLAEACVFSDLPWENACSITVVKLAVDAAGNIDPFDTTSLEDTLQRARQDIPVFKPDTSDVITKPWGELVLTEKDKAPPPAEPSAAVTKEAAPAPATQPAPGSASPVSKPEPAKPSNSPQTPVSASVEGPAAASAPPPVALPKVAPAPAPVAPVGTKPISPNTKMPEHVPYRIDPTAGLKPMEETERFVGAALMLFGTFARVIMAQGTALTGVGGIVVVAVLDMMKSPTNLAILVTIIAMVVTGVLWFVGFVIDKLGLKIKKRGERASTQAMY